MVLYHPQQIFVDLFQTRSKSHPRLLLTLYLRDAKEQFIFSAPKHTEDDKSSCSSVMARYDMPISAPGYNVICGSVNGFVCFRGVLCNTITVYNPTTRQVVKLPDAKPNGRCMNLLLGQDIPQEQWVCTASSSSHEKQEWRKMEKPTGDDYGCAFGVTCIDGAVYY
ncbi:F-box family protein [Raphanus sativus]|nr:F-box family protein [Raphanus sativus]